MNTTPDTDCRLAYEAVCGRCSDSHWWRFRKGMKKAGLELNPKNVRFYAELKRKAPRSNVSMKVHLEAYRKAEEFTKHSNRTHKGIEVLNILQRYGIKPHQTTISRWFADIGGYRRKRDYTSDQLKEILVTAFLYKIRNSDRLPTVN